MPPPDVRTVIVAGGRLRGGWPASRTGTARSRLTPGRTAVDLTGADGARAWIDVPFPPLVRRAGRSRRRDAPRRRAARAAWRARGRRLRRVHARRVQGRLVVRAGDDEGRRLVPAEGSRRRANQSKARRSPTRPTSPSGSCCAEGARWTRSCAAVTARPSTRSWPTHDWRPWPSWSPGRGSRSRTRGCGCSQAAPEQFLAVRIRLLP